MSSVPAPVSSAEVDRGRAMFRRIFGPHYGEELCAQLDTGEFNRVLICRIAPEVWERPNTPLTTKILCAIVACTAAHQDIRYFVRAAIYHGITRAEVEDVIFLAGLESGFPSAGAARRLVEEGYQEHNKMLERLNLPAIAW
jgi:alkylhydroperoxidase/carboxymuconolactone decarboxylase family protein YurZ